MDIFFKCIHCGQRLVVDDAGIGMEIPCPACAKSVVIPPESTLPAEEGKVPPPPAPKLPEPVLPPIPPVVTFTVRPRPEPLPQPAPPPAAQTKPLPVVEAPVPKNLHAPIAPPRVRRPLASPPPPRKPRPAPALAPALLETLAPVPPNLRAPAAPRRVRWPLAKPPLPRAPQPAPVLPDGLLASLTPPEPPPPPVPPPAPAPRAPREAPAFAPRAAKLPPTPPAPKIVEPVLPEPPSPPPASRAPRRAPAFAPRAAQLPAPPPAPVVAVAAPSAAPAPPPTLPVAPKLPEPVLTPPPPAPPAPRKAPAFASRATKLPPPPAAPKLPEPVAPPAPVVAIVAPPPPPAPRAPRRAPAFAPRAARLPAPPPAPKLPEPALSPAPVVAIVAPLPSPPAPAPVLQGIVPPLDLGFPKAGLTPAPRKPSAKATATTEELNALLAKPATPPPAAPAPPKPEPVAVVQPAPVATAPAAVRLVDISGPAKAEADQWRDLAAALARQLWSSRSPMPLRATVIEAFLHAMPRLIAIRGDGSAAADNDGVRGRWGDPFAGDRPDIVGRFDRPDFEGIAARISELIERWMQHQENQARQPGSDAEEISFIMMPVPHSAVVTFGMNYHQRGSTGRKRVACWVARVGENRFLFVGKIPPSVSVTLPGFVQSFRAEAGEPSLPMPRAQIFSMPPPPDVDSENALTMRRLMINFCEAYFVRFDNRLAAELYDQIRRRREIARAIIPGMVQVMPPSREKRMLQQLSREL